jgi:hypothetical protein
MRISDHSALVKKRPGMFATLWQIACAAGSIKDCDKSNDTTVQQP